MEKSNFNDRVENLKKNHDKQEKNKHSFKKKTRRVTYTTILHERREFLKLSMPEYSIADIIYHLSNAPDSKNIGGWCFASKQGLADSLKVSKRSVEMAINKLIKADLLEKDLETRFLRTTTRWYTEVVLYREKFIT